MIEVPLGDVADIIMGQAPPGDSYNTEGRGLPLIAGAGDFKEGRLAPSRFTSKATKRSQNGDIVVSIRASIGDAVWADGEYCLGRGVAALRGRSEHVFPAYLWHWLANATPALRAKGRGATFLQVNRQDIGEMTVPLPSLAEQRRIAAILDQADAIRTKRRQILDSLVALERSLFEEVGLAGGRRLSLADAGVNFISGSNVLGSGNDIHPVNRVLKVSAISSGSFVVSETKPMPRDYEPPQNHRVNKGDILFGRASGSLDLLGATAVVDTSVGSLYLPDKVWRLELSRDSLLLPSFALAILRSESARAYIRHNASGAAGVRNIAKSKLLRLPIRVPDLEIQKEYAKQSEAIAQMYAIARRALSADDALFASLQSRAFKGEL